MPRLAYSRREYLGGRKWWESVAEDTELAREKWLLTSVHSRSLVLLMSNLEGAQF